MDSNGNTGCLLDTWRNYLLNRGHFVYRIRNNCHFIRSRDGSKKIYRWLLYVSKHSDFMLNKSELSYIRNNLRKAKSQKEVTYLVVGFLREPGRIIVLPAKAVLKDKLVRSDIGGIAWNNEPLV